MIRAMHPAVRFSTVVRLAAAGLLLLVAGGCRGSSPEGDAPPVASVTPSPAAPDTLAGAPEDPTAFLGWAAERLTTFPAPVAVPTPQPVAPRWGVVHLVDRLDTEADGDPAADAATRRPLAEVGPFRSDSEDAGARTKRFFHRKLGELISMQVGGFSLPTEDIGSIEVEVRVPFGRYVELSWSIFGFARMPLPDNEEFWTLRVATDGFEDWTGTLEGLAVRTDGVGEGAIEVRALRLYGHREAYPDDVATTAVTLGGTRRPTLYVRPPSTVPLADVRVPPSGKFRASVGRLAPGGSAEVRVAVVTDDGAKEVVTASIEDAGQWHDVTAPLEDWAGRRVTIELSATSTAPDDVVFWGDPTLYEPVASPPILVVYLIDTLSAEHIGFYGHDNPTMPTLRALAESGAWFEHMYCNSPVTISSIPDLMLSVSTERHGVHSPSLRPPAAFRMLPEVLRRAGYATFSAVTNVNAGPRQAMDRGFGTFVDRIAFAKEHEADRTVPLPEVREWIDAHGDRPMFLYIHTAEPHAPYLPPPGYAERFDPDYEGTLQLHGTSGLPLVQTKRDLAHVRALYDAEVLYADARLAAFLDALDELGVRARTTILLTADHGEELLDHGKWGHGPGLYDEVLRVPLVLAGADIPAVGRVERPVQMYDVKPTVLALADVPPTHPLEGTSVLPLLADPTAGEDRPIVVSHHRFWGHRQLEYAVLADERWKLIFTFQPVPGGGVPSRFQLYDAAADPDERKNLVHDEPAVVRRLVGALLEYAARQPAVAEVPASAVEYDAEQLEQLRALGYVE